MPAKRAYGMDQDFYPWSPIVTRPVLRWPDNARVALAVIVNLEHWDWEVPAGTPLAVSPMGGPEGMWTGNQPQFPGYRRLRQPRIRQPGRDLSHPRRAGQVRHHADPGARQGGRRPLPVPGQRGPEARRRVHRARSVAPAHHPYRHVRGRGAASISAPRSRRSRRRPASARSAGPAPTSRRRRTPPTCSPAEGIRYVCDWGNDEQPYQMTPKTGELYSLGVNAYLDDNYIHLHGRRTDQRGQPAVARVVRRSLRRRCHHRTADGAASASVDHGPALAHPASRRGARPHLRPSPACGRRPAARSSTGSRRRRHRHRRIDRRTNRHQADGEDSMALAPGRFDYAPITERPIIKWPDNARVAFWVAPNMEFFEYLPENRPTQPDIPHYSRMDYGNRVGFWRMLDVLNKHKVRACCCLNLEILDHFPEIKDAMIAADWDYMAHGLYNSRPIYDLHRGAGAGLLAGLHHPSQGDDRQAPERTARRRRRATPCGRTI